MPLMPKHLRLPLLHPSGMIHVGDRRRPLIPAIDRREHVLIDPGHGEAGLAAVRDAGGRSLDRCAGGGTVDGNERRATMFGTRRRRARDGPRTKLHVRRDRLRHIALDGTGGNRRQGNVHLRGWAPDSEHVIVIPSPEGGDRRRSRSNRSSVRGEQVRGRTRWDGQFRQASKVIMRRLGVPGR